MSMIFFKENIVHRLKNLKKSLLVIKTQTQKKALIRRI